MAFPRCGGRRAADLRGDHCLHGPEVLAVGERDDMVGYTYKADCWSLGVILCLLLSGKHPFSKGQEMVKHVMEGKFRSMTGSVWDTVSCTAKGLVRALLETDHNRRY